MMEYWKNVGSRYFRIWESFGYTPSPYFQDVPDTHVFFKYVQKLKDTGITVLSGTYRIDDYVTREEMAAFIGRAFLGMK